MNVKAFPSSANEPTKGMDLRDYFAAHASDGDIQSIPTAAWVGHEHIEFTRQQRRYMFADAMLAARKKDT